MSTLVKIKIALVDLSLVIRIVPNALPDLLPASNTPMMYT